MGELMQLPEESKDIIIGATERIQVRLRKTVEDIILIGQDLSLIKENLAHGQFTDWISKNFEMNHRTANNFINAYTRFKDRVDLLDHVKPSILYQLAAPSTPDEVVDEVIEMDKSPTVKELEEMKSNLKREVARRKQLEEHQEQVLEETNKKLDEAKKQIKELRSESSQAQVNEVVSSVSTEHLTVIILCEQLVSKLAAIRKEDSDSFYEMMEKIKLVNEQVSKIML
jgi:hypothetical protein